MQGSLSFTDGNWQGYRQKDLLAVIAEVPPEQRDLPNTLGEWSLKDTLVHLNFWGGQLVTLLYQFAPYRLVDMHFRLDLGECVDLMKGFIQRNPSVWNEDIGV